MKRAMLAACATAAGLLVGCTAALPPSEAVKVPALRIGGDSRAGVLRAYGPPKIKTADMLWYVGPTPTSLEHGADGWMTLLLFGHDARLLSQEYLARARDQGYHHVEYWLRGDLTKRKREHDLDTLLLAGCVELAGRNANYRVTLNEPDFFVLARVLPSENEPVVTWRYQEDGPSSRVEMTVNALPGRDEPLLEQIDGKIGLRMLIIEVPADAEANP